MWYFPDRRVIRGMAGRRLSQFPYGPPLYLLILQQPSATAVSGVALAQQPIIRFVDAYGNIVAGPAVTVTATPSAGALTGSAAVAVASDGAATFTTLALVLTTIGSPTLTFSAPGFASVVSNPIAIFGGTAPKLWLEADFGITDADGAALTAWHDRSGNALDTSTGAGMSAPVYHASGFGGSTLPYLDFINAHGILTPSAAALALSTFTIFVVALRGNTDGNGNYYEQFVGTVVNTGMRDRATAIFVQRDPGALVSSKEKVNAATTWIPRNVRQILRHQFDGTHAGDKMFIAGVDQALVNSAIPPNDPGVGATGNGSMHIGYRDSGTPSLNLTGQMAAVMVYSPALSGAETTAVETYLQKWLASAGSATHGPILLQSSVIDGVTVTVDYYVAGSDIRSSDSSQGYLVFHFSQTIKRFSATQVQGLGPPFHDTGGTRVMIGASGYTGPPWSGTYTTVVTGAFATGVAGDRETIFAAGGFDTVIVKILPKGSYNGGSSATFYYVQPPASELLNCRFSLLADP